MEDGADGGDRCGREACEECLYVCVYTMIDPRVQRNKSPNDNRVAARDTRLHEQDDRSQSLFRSVDRSSSIDVNRRNLSNFNVVIIVHQSPVV